ncbi:phage tail tape measure protein [Methylocystis parvus]|uniref:Phage tail tape measure protein n=1 Tax=Methylocystis parvus TaxID=134 RepID=A0A6B8M5R6_9HYPH|nr:phage tail tape measure protein [Methylocystis parvus]QGM97798.1 phage tail tape measure protein [Methylocystis parvus]WBK01894.1 phage tail tape measure protein [Methylocystis parvus OBBP]
MAVKSLKSELQISATDKTADTFSRIAGKMRGLESTATAVSRRMDSVTRGMSAAYIAQTTRAAQHAAVAARMSNIAPVLAGAGFGAKLRAINARLAGIGDRASDFASAALPGTAGMALGMGGAALSGLAVGGAATYGLKQAMSFDKAMADVKKKVTLDAGATFADVEAMINKTSRDIGISREDMAALAAQAGQAGIAYKDLSGFMQLAAKASSAWDVPAKEAAQTLSEIKAQTGWTNKELEAYADKVNYLGDISAAAEKDISAMWAKTSAGAKEAGVAYDDAMVALTAMRSVGMQEDVASRAFGQLSSRLRTASSQNKGFNAAIKSLGFTPAGIEKAMQKDAMGTIMTVMDRLGKNKDSVKLAVGLGGKEWWDEFLRIKAALPEMQRLLTALKSGKAGGSLSQSLATDLATTSKHLERFGALTSEIGDRLTRWALPTINEQLERTLKAFDSAQKTGFLAGPDGKPIDRLADKTPVPFGADNRALFLKGPQPFSTSLVPTLPTLPTWVSAAESAIADSPANIIGNWQKLQMAADRFDAEKNAPVAARAYGVDRARSGILGFGLGGPQSPMTPVAKLEGAANISLTIRVEAERGSIVRDVVQEVKATGALRNDNNNGVTMLP